MSSDAIRDFAKILLESGKDRVPSVPDRRRLPAMRRKGLLEYPDGYSLTNHAMEDALDWFKMVLRDAEKHQTTAVERLRTLVERGEQWIKKHQRTPDLQKLKFGDLHFDAYHVVWEIVTKGKVTADFWAKKIREPLVRKGYLVYASPRGDIDPSGKGQSPFVMLQPTDDALKLVTEYGDPYLSQKTASKYSYDRRPV